MHNTRNKKMSNDLVTKKESNSLLNAANFEHAQRVAIMMSKSEMVPKNYIGKPQDILLAMEYGVSLGLAPLAAVQNIAVINGKPSIYGDGLIAVCSGHPDFKDIIEEPILGKDNVMVGYMCTIKRHGRTDTIRTFTIEDAKVSGLWGKVGPWKLYPSRMLQMRARAFALRDAFADALGGIRVAEEVQTFVNVRDVTPKKQKNQLAKDQLLGLLNKETGEIEDEPEETGTATSNETGTATSNKTGHDSA